MQEKNLNRTHHESQTSLPEILERLKQKVIHRGNLPHVSVKAQMEIIQQLNEFPLGRFILERKGANGFWTDYMISPPQVRASQTIDHPPLHPMEDFFLHRCPIILAHRERFKIFQQLAETHLKSNMTLASIPCGLMRDLLTLDLSLVSNIKFLGIDIDNDSLFLARNLATELGIQNVELVQGDAWNLSYHEELDVITSSGLNVYESDPNKVVSLYSQFFKALKTGGILITSVLTYPPGESQPTDWDLSKIREEDLLLDQIIHKDILDIRWRNFRSSSELCQEFLQAGFSEVSVHFDQRRIFPTILAKKTEG